MDGVAAGAAGHVHELIDAKITFARGCRANGISFVGEADVKACAVDFTEDDDGTDAKFATGAQNAHGDFPAIGDQDFFEHALFAVQRNISMRDGRAGG
jgi:hypothetical protein